MTVSQLVDMGFPIEGCKKAVYYTGNSGVEPAMNWVMEHMEDPGKIGNVVRLPNSDSMSVLIKIL